LIANREQYIKIYQTISKLHQKV